MCFRAFLLVASASVFGPNLFADSLAALPTSPQRIEQGQGSTESSVSTYGVTPLGTLGSFNAGNSAFQILALPDGSKYWVVSHSASNTVMSIDSHLQKVTLVASLPTPATAAAITPDGSKLLVANGTLHIFSTSNDKELVSGGITLTGYSINDVAVSLDGKTAYALGLSTTGQGWQLTAVDLAANSALGQPKFGQTGTASAVAVGPNGLVYVSWQNQIVELNPSTLTLVNPNVSAIGVNGLPGKLVFTPDGALALAVNTEPITSYALFLINLKTHVVTPIRAGTSFPTLSGNLDTILVANAPVGNSTNNQYNVFAYSTSSQTLWQVGIDSTGTNVAVNPSAQAIGGIDPTTITGVALSNELPSVSNNTGANYIFVATQDGHIYQILHPGSTSIIANQLPNQPVSSGALQYIGLPSTGPAVTLLQYGINQQVAPGGTSLPIVVRAIDGQGKPVMGVNIAFAASTNTATLSVTTATTGADGFAETFLTAPNSNNIPPITVTATTPVLNGQKFPFNIQVGTSTAPSSGTLSILAGQGQLLTSAALEISGFSPLEVVFKDANGNPIKNQAVNFTSTNLLGTLTIHQGFPGTQITNGISVTTNAQGQAWADYNPQTVIGSTVAVTIKAQAPNSNTIQFFETAWDPSFPPSINLTPATPQPGAIFTTKVGVKQAGAFTAVIRDVSTGLPIPNVAVTACIPGSLVQSGGGTARPCVPPATDEPKVFADCDPSTSLSDSHGVATCDLIPRNTTGSFNNLGFSVGNLTNFAPYTLIVNPGPPAVVNILNGNNQTGKPGQQLPAALLVQVVDAGQHPVGSGVQIAWSVLPAGVPATLQSSSSATDPNGEASTLVTLGNTAGTVLIQVTASTPQGSASQTFSLTITNPAAGIQVVSGNSQSTLIGTNFSAPIVVKVIDGQGTAVNGAPVTFAVTSGIATVGTPSTTTTPDGQASTTVTAGATAGNIVVTATSGNFSVTFTLTANLPGPQNIIFVNGASFQLQSACPAPGCVSPGEVVTIEGSGFATGVQGVMSGTSIAGPLATNLAGASITFNGVAAPIFYIANVNGVESMGVQVPFETQPGTAAVVLTGAGGGSANLNVPVNAYTPGTFTTAYGNQVVAVAVRSDGSYVSPSNPAQLGETIYLFVTGLGVTSPAASTGAQGANQSVTAPIVTGLNNKGVPHGKVYYAPGLVGVYIIAFSIPTDPSFAGSSVPISFLLVDPSSGTKYYSQHANIPIAAP